MPSILIENQTIVGDYDGRKIENQEDAMMTGCSITSGMRTGIRLLKNKRVYIRDTTIKASTSATQEKYAYGILIGKSADASYGNTNVYLNNVNILGYGPPSSNYNVWNRDAISIEIGNGPVYIKGGILDGGTDGGIDTKSDVLAKGVTIRNFYRPVRVHGSATATLVNCNLSGPMRLFSIHGDKSKIRFYNCLFNGKPDIDWSKVDCHNGSSKYQVEVLTSDPFENIAFFKDPIVVEPPKPKIDIWDCLRRTVINPLRNRKK